MSVANITKEGNCCGCTVCVAVCPKKCISMQMNSHGAMQSEVNLKRCIECGKCEDICPAIDSLRDASEPKTAYATWSRNSEILEGCTSGGVATTLSRWIIRKGGVVYGCAANGLEIRHIRVDREEDLFMLKGSKYVHSDMSSSVPMLIKDLQKGIQVLFIGTPCQVEAVKRVAGKHRNQLLTVDLICHGVPTQRMLCDHLAYKIPVNNISKIQFRQGSEYCFTLTDINGICYRGKGLWNDMYLRAFMKGWSLRENCHKCVFSNQKRSGDITIGDFWGLSIEVKRPKKAHGTSLVLPITATGVKALDENMPSIKALERPINEAISGNLHLNHPSPLNRGARWFKRMYPLLPFDLAVYICCIPSKTRTLIQRICNNIF